MGLGVPALEEQGQTRPELPGVPGHGVVAGAVRPPPPPARGRLARVSRLSRSQSLASASRLMLAEDLRAGRDDEAPPVLERRPGVRSPAEVEHEVDGVDRVQPDRLRANRGEARTSPSPRRDGPSRAAWRSPRGPPSIVHQGSKDPGSSSPSSRPRRYASRISMPSSGPEGAAACVGERRRLFSGRERDQRVRDVPAPAGGQPVGDGAGVGDPARLPQKPADQDVGLLGAGICRVREPAVAVPVDERDPAAALLEGEGDRSISDAICGVMVRGRPLDRVEPARGGREVHPRHQAGKHGGGQPGGGLDVVDARAARRPPPRDRRLRSARRRACA